MKFYSRKLIKPENLNGNNTLFGGALLRWIDEEAFIYAATRLKNSNVVTKYMSEINFLNSARQGEVIELGMELTGVGRTSITFKCLVRNLFTQKEIISIEKIVFVQLGSDERPMAHGVTMESLTNTN
jgi:acyl-CoA hydrolase